MEQTENTEQAGKKAEGGREDVSPRNILLALAVLAAASPLVVALLMWAGAVPAAFRTRMAEKAAMAPLLKQAREQRLTYESALADPRGSVGKPALWCLKRASAQRGYTPLPGSTEAAAAAAAPEPVKSFTETYYGGPQGPSVFIDNPWKFYSISAGMQEACVNTLVRVKSVQAHDFGAGPHYRLEAEFIGYP
jgi:hypothetical protein